MGALLRENVPAAKQFQRKLLLKQTRPIRASDTAKTDFSSVLDTNLSFSLCV